MYLGQKMPSTAELDAAMERTSQLARKGNRETRMAALRIMACIVSNYPHGPMQDRASDALQGLIMDMRPSSDEVEMIQYIRDSEISGDLGRKLLSNLQRQYEAIRLRHAQPDQAAAAQAA